MTAILHGSRRNLFDVKSLLLTSIVNANVPFMTSLVSLPMVTFPGSRNRKTMTFNVVFGAGIKAVKLNFLARTFSTSTSTSSEKLKSNPAKELNECLLLLPPCFPRDILFSSLSIRLSIRTSMERFPSSSKRNLPDLPTGPASWLATVSRPNRQNKIYTINSDHWWTQSFFHF